MGNRFTPYHAPSAAKAKELCKGVKSMPERYRLITAYIDKVIVYDFIKAITMPKKNGLPDVARCWDKRTGICLDIAALTVNMLRAVSISCNLVIGWADRNYHAWVEAKVDGRRIRYDYNNPSGDKVQTYKKDRLF